MDIRDLLVRHEKLVHLNDASSKENNARPRPSSSSASSHKPSLSDGHVEADTMNMHRTTLPPVGPPPPQQMYHPQPPMPNNVQPMQQSMQQDHAMKSRMAACNLDVLSDAALASEVNSMAPMMSSIPQQPTSHARGKSFGQVMPQFGERQPQDQTHSMPSFAQPPAPQPAYDDYNVFLDDFSFAAPHFLPPHFEPDQPMNMWTRSPATMNQRMASKPVSAMPSRIGSLGPDTRDATEFAGDTSRPSPLRISNADYAVIKKKIDEFSSVLPSDFAFPSRHTLTRFVEGYISGFHDLLPVLHLPTLSPAVIAPELLLAILAVGAQYRFESNRGYALWYAAKAVALEQIRRRRNLDIHAPLSNAAMYSPHSTRPSPTSGYRNSFGSGQSERPSTHDGHRDSVRSSLNTPQARLETIQALLLLFAVGLWGIKTILHESLSLQSNLSILIREEGLHMNASQASIADWETWIQREGALRTKLIAFCFFNLCSMTYDMPPALLTSEVHLFLPLTARLWRAETAWQWQELRQTTPLVEITLHEAFSKFFGANNAVLPSELSSLGHYVLIHALIQHVYLLKQTSFAAGLTYDIQRTLRPEDVEQGSQALRMWHTSFEQRHQLLAAERGHYGSTDTMTGGSLVYNATALLRLAYIRLYTDTPPSRALQTRDSMLIASAMHSTPGLPRNLRVQRAVFQATHALSMLVKVGVNYVAKAKSTEWSIQHSLCNFECAILVAKWLMSLACIGPQDAPASEEEMSLLETVRRMVDETEFAISQRESNVSDAIKLRQLASAVVRLWSETFKGTHIFDMVKTMGDSLDGYANLVEKS
ncbi:Transcription factor [Cordyceps fumosorosea ARSEF 2679]|uniref:Transcription factor n=1 Tax=Cordyceps fumosorosea (strain ARSEF 2679) TaxID=1081104 RepID=A0A167SBR0_CORFA|nr:Transcription factor [Cordyceps fumosorosea ARSEF 2679]OAA59460.1 Transcription factor [Cordyceps fumosorosea ARSEF 2679]